MSAAYTTQPAWSGPFYYNFLNPNEDIVVDVFGKSSMRISQSPVIYPEGLREENQAEYEFTLLPSMTSWTTVVMNAIPGTYRVFYVSGAVSHLPDPVPFYEWNRGYVAPLTSDPLRVFTQRPWLKSGSNVAMLNGFRDDGYPTYSIAEAECRLVTTDFVHHGGNIEVFYDVPPGTQGFGSIAYRMRRLPYFDGKCFWQVVYSSLPNREDWPEIEPGMEQAEYPHVRNIKPGVHLLEFVVQDVDDTIQTQRYWIWVWKTPPRYATADYVKFTPLSQDAHRPLRVATYGHERLPWDVFPLRLPKIAPDRFGVPEDTRVYLEQLPKISGNQSGIPGTQGHLPREPRQLGSTESF